ncbi:MAG: PepSY-associated TM helix domain-containing protein [bacterium]
MKPRKILFWIHLSVGVTAGLIIGFIAATGCLLAFRPIVTPWMESSQNRVVIPAQPIRISLNRLAALAVAGSPGLSVTGVTLASDPEASVLFNLSGDQVRYLDPYRGKVLGLGAERTRSFFKEVEGLHRWFGLEGASRQMARQVKGVVVLLFGFMILSGWVLWWPRSWTLASFRASLVPGFKERAKARDWNWHNAIGFWFAPWLLLIVLTGLIMLYPWANDLLYTLSGNEPPPRQVQTQAAGSLEKGKNHSRPHRNGVEKHRVKAISSKPISLDLLLADLNQEVPGWKSASIHLPQGARREVTVLTQEASSTRSFERGQLTLNAATGEVEKWEPYSAQNLGMKLRLWARFVHTGEAGGFWGELLAALVAFGALVMIWTGLAMAWRRFLGRSAKS